MLWVSTRLFWQEFCYLAYKLSIQQVLQQEENQDSENSYIVGIDTGEDWGDGVSFWNVKTYLRLLAVILEVMRN